MLAEIRDFFQQRNVLEVDTPRLAAAGVTDCYLDNFVVPYDFSPASSRQHYYLQTSPEYAMKRLLASGSGCIYQIAPAFRHESASKLHNPEFTLLEWYRVGFAMADLVEEVAALLCKVLGAEYIEQTTYQQAFLAHTNVDPLQADKQALLQYCQQQNIALYDSPENLQLDNLQQLIFALHVEPYIGQQSPCIVTHFPANQAALAKIDPLDNRVARRFEVYHKGIELANGFEELTDADEQKRRFEADNVKRVALGKPQMPIDEHFLSALQAGMPDCSGVALGIDRLLMLKLGVDNIEDVLSFPIHNA